MSARVCICARTHAQTCTRKCTHVRSCAHALTPEIRARQRQRLGISRPSGFCALFVSCCFDVLTQDPFVSQALSLFFPSDFLYLSPDPSVPLLSWREQSIIRTHGPTSSVNARKRPYICCLITCTYPSLKSLNRLRARRVRSVSNSCAARLASFLGGRCHSAGQAVAYKIECETAGRTSFHIAGLWDVVWAGERGNGRPRSIGQDNLAVKRDG